MKIHFDSAYGSQNVDNTLNAYGQPKAAQKTTKGSYQTDISGTVMDNNAYAGHGRTAEDVMAEAGQQDVAMQRNYMAVMSNSMSDEDFAKLQEQGFHPGQEEIERVVTILDEIKAQLLQAGADIAGYTDTLDKETLAQITGSESYAETILHTFAQYDVPPTRENIAKTVEAVQEALQLKEPSDSAVKYMVQNRMEPSLQNLYLAQHGTNGQARPAGGYYSTETGGYYAKKADTVNWEQLTPAMEQVVEEASQLAEEAPTMEEAKWLVEQGIELNAENLNRLHQIRSIDFPLKPESVIETAAIALTDGRKPDRTALDSEQTAGEHAVSIQEAVAAMTEETADAAAWETGDGILNLKALKAAWRRQQQGEYQDAPAENIAARRMLEEVRLQMTLEANLKLIKSDFAIETAPLVELIEALKQAQQDIQNTLFGEGEETAVSEKAALYQKTMETASWLPLAPAAAIGKIAEQYQNTTLEEFKDEAVSLQKSYEKAERSYETLMSAPRADLGDSIKKAFRNVDDILDDMGLETTETNRRAVRILGYNSMEITPEQIARVKAADLTVQNVVEKMTPGAVLQMIRDGKNPLEMSLGELDFYFSEQENPEREMERYSRYLYRLEQNQDITEEEKTGYIGVFRMLRQLEKNDGAAVGSLVEQGLELTFSNLLTALRTARKGGLDVKLDDNIGGVSRKDTGAQDITGQIQTAFQKELHTVREQLSPDMLRKGVYTEDMSLEAFYEAVREEAVSEEEKQAEADYRREELTYYRRAAAVSEAAVEELLSYQQPVSADYALAAQSMLYSRGQAWKKTLEKQDAKQLEETLKRLQDSFDSEGEAKEAYENFVDQIREETAETAQTEDTQAVDVKEKLLLHKQLSLYQNLSQEENYEVPVLVQGKLTSVNLRIIHTSGQPGKAAVALESEEYGKLAGEFTVRENQVTGYLTCSSSQGKEYLEGLQKRMEEGLKQQGYEQSSLHTVMARDLDLVSFSQRVTQGRQQSAEAPLEQRQSANALYRVAKLFLQNV